MNAVDVSADVILGRTIQDTFREYEDAVDLSSRKKSDLNKETLAIPRIPFTSPKLFRNQLPAFKEKIQSTTVDVVIPLYGTSESLEECLDALEKSRGIKPNVILVDNGAPAELVDRAGTRSIVVRVIRNTENKGFGGGCDQGIVQSTSDFVILLNSDAIVEEDTCAALVYECESNDRVAVAGAMCFKDNGNLDEFGRYILPNGHSFPYGESDNPLDARFLSSRFVPYVSFVCVALNKPHYKDVGGFSEKYFPAYYEDTDLSFRFHNKGLKVLVSPYARVVHKGSQSAAELPEVADIRDKNREQFVSDHAHQLSIMSFDADVVRYPHEGEKLMRRVYPSKKLVMAYRLEDVHEYLSDDKDTFVSIVSFHGTQGDVARLRRLGFEVSIGFGKKLHHWVRERILLFDEIIFCDAFSFERMNEILAFTQPQARVIYEVDSQAEKSGAS